MGCRPVQAQESESEHVSGQSPCVQLRRVVFLLCLDMRGGFLFTLDPCIFLGSLVLECRVSLPHGAQPSIPNGEEWLGEIRLDAPALMVDIMVCSVVTCNVLQRIPRQRVSTVIVDGLGGAEYKKEE